ncbi:MAG: hypothetical protein H6828_00345 [Planctomycetes bacterium]|nr:hypothetical protein [Planctomycetota bacterium]
MRSLAALLGQCVSTRGADLMRAFPFSSESGGDPEALARLVAPLALPPRASDPNEPQGKGRLVWWHENLAALVDASGFCAFSAAGVLADGVWDLARLARVLAPEAGGARAWQALGATLVLLQRELDERLGARATTGTGRAGRPRRWTCRACSTSTARCAASTPPGACATRARALLGREALLDVGLAELAPLAAEPRARARAAARARRVALRAFGALRDELGAERTLDLALPCPLREVLDALAADAPRAARLMRAAAAQRAGRRVLASDLVRDGDVLDLVLALSGG